MSGDVFLNVGVYRDLIASLPIKQICPLMLFLYNELHDKDPMSVVLISRSHPPVSTFHRGQEFTTKSCNWLGTNPRLPTVLRPSRDQLPLGGNQRLGYLASSSDWIACQSAHSFASASNSSRETLRGLNSTISCVSVANM